jgi:plasmid stability protein
MAILHVRKVPDDLYERLRARAAAHRRSLSAEVIALLEQELGQPRRPVRELLNEIDRLRKQYPLPPGAPDVVDLLREDRAR